MEATPGFQAWIARFRTVRVDGEPLWVVGGDQLRDHAQMTDLFRRLHHAEDTEREGR
ncbi:hypothetical protein Apa02nite_017100 [Actinoplanes palleronii]|uniref:Uncharacterized protein n=1 Tax=Actinoplanes palleronii TaxID=113570 RepID=A0ABQ4B4L2_9ACTN|nr:hypothetical protein Apa02nite_017100 [Actinoplanes palleronii]